MTDTSLSLSVAGQDPLWVSLLAEGLSQRADVDVRRTVVLAECEPGAVAWADELLLLQLTLTPGDVEQFAFLRGCRRAVLISPRLSTGQVTSLLSAYPCIRGLITPDLSVSAVYSALVSVERGLSVISADVHLSDLARAGDASPAMVGDAAATGLTAGELEVLVEVAAGRTNKEIAARLFLSMGTVKNRLRSIAVKWGVSGRSAILLTALEKGLLRN